MKQNLARSSRRRERRRVVVILAGMEAPPNYGPEYAASFGRRIRDLAPHTSCRSSRSCSTRWPGRPALNQADGIHPNPQGAAIVADTVWTMLSRVRQLVRLMIELRGVSKTVTSGVAR